jgi:DNA-binding NarL/FixJ family response regulator
MHSNSPRLRILVADDHELVRRGIRGLLTSKLRCRIVGEARDGSEAIAQSQALQPDIVILDIDMPVLNGLEAAPRIRSVVPQTKIIVLTLHESPEMATRALHTGADALVLKSDLADGLIMAIRQTSRNKRFITRKLSHLVTRAAANISNTKVGDALPPGRPTSREREVIRLLSAGMANKEIAATLAISVRTAEMHRANIMKKLGFRSLAELVLYAIDEGLTTAATFARVSARTPGA